MSDVIYFFVAQSSLRDIPRFISGRTDDAQAMKDVQLKITSPATQMSFFFTV
jgi:hypothetical protein